MAALAAGGAWSILITPADAIADKAKAAPTTSASEKLPLVTIVPAETREVTETAVVSGTLVPREEVLVAVEIENLAITEILVEEGDRVAKGQVLARLQRATLDAQLEQNKAQTVRTEALIAQSKAQIVEVEANLADAGNQLARARQLKESGYASLERFEQRQLGTQTWTAKLNAARQALAVAEAERAAMLAQRHELEVRIARTEIKAPKAGIVSRRSARLGMVATMAGEPPFRLIAEGEIELEAEVADVNLPRIAVGQAVAVTPAGFSQASSGRIRLVSPEVDKTTRLGRVRVSVDSSERLPIGAFARGVVEIGRRTGVTLPQSAVTFGKDGASVQVIEKGPKGSAIKSRAVTLGLAGGGRIEIAAGLKPGEQVVARAGTFLREGDRVETVDEGAVR
jgi:HlyD family secretion protein